MILVEDLVVSYGRSDVLKGVSLSVPEGEILCVMGASGGGKTTLLKAVAGLVWARSGRVEVAGVDVRAEPERARLAMGLVFQYGALFDYLNVQENVLFGLRRKVRLGAKLAAETAERLLGQVGLPGTGAMMPSELSGGMRKRVALARALATEPQVLLYDEPGSGLDPVTAFAIDRLIVETRDRTGSTAVVVSHDVTSVVRVADSVAFLVAGEVAYWGPPEGLAGCAVPGVQEVLAAARAESLTGRGC